MEKVCIYPGSFDPLTIGHMDVIHRASRLFDRVVVAVLHNPAKVGCFPTARRLEMIRKACASMPNVEADAFSGLLADYVDRLGAAAVIRGIRGESDFSSEAMMAQVNRRLNPRVETIFLLAKPEHACISSSMVREVASFGGDVSPFLPEEVLPYVTAAFSKKE
ncbi:MAG: pantetheine-phosphate adenylyltransferase [Clostridia bacterium]|nr:pantetheine-phosphate adenylyltransferase [Clostridia bacterium]